jgi:hypothetical protein
VLGDEELHNLYSSANSIKSDEIKKDEIGRHVANMGKLRCRLWGGDLKGWRSIWRLGIGSSINWCGLDSCSLG